jgi:hypothetical protein
MCEQLQNTARIQPKRGEKICNCESYRISNLCIDMKDGIWFGSLFDMHHDTGPKT